MSVFSQTHIAENSQSLKVIISGLSSPEVLKPDGWLNYARAIGLYAFFIDLLDVTSEVLLAASVLKSA